MASRLLPIFPLSFVLLPAMSLPLHIFEERYKEMMADIIEEGGEFGVVFAQKDGIVNVGCSAKIDRVVNRYADGRLDVLTTGQRRFQISSLDEEKSYLRADVSYFGDEDTREASPELQAKAIEGYRQLLQIERPEVIEEEKLERSRLSFHVAQYIYDLEKRQTVLALRSEVERLEFLVKIIPEYIVRQERMARAKRVGPQNGHAKPN
jgi:Lon protease-like protein